MKGILAVESEGPRGPAYIRFSNEAIARTDDRELVENNLLIDRDNSGTVVGIELISVDLDAMNALVNVARRNNLDLSALVARSFVAPADSEIARVCALTAERDIALSKEFDGTLQDGMAPQRS